MREETSTCNLNCPNNAGRKGFVAPVSLLTPTQVQLEAAGRSQTLLLLLNHHCQLSKPTDRNESSKVNSARLRHQFSRI